MKQLREMDGKPAWIVPLGNEDWDPHRAIRKYRRFSADSKTIRGRTYFLYEDSYRVRWLAYPYPPLRVDLQGWSAHWIPMTDDDGCVWLECSGCGHDLDSMEDAYDFCPRCGKAMTKNAIAILKERFCVK